MNLVCRKKDIFESEMESIVVPMYEGAQYLMLGNEIASALSAIINAGFFSDKEERIRNFFVTIMGETKKVYALNITKEMNILKTGESNIYGSDYDPHAVSGAFRALGATLGRALVKDNIKSVSILAFEDMWATIKREQLKRFLDTKNEAVLSTAAIVGGLLLSIYRYDMFKHEAKPIALQNIEVMTRRDDVMQFMDETSNHKWLELCRHVNIVRDLVNAPSNVLLPETFAEYVKTSSISSIAVDVLDENELEEKGLQLVSAVGRGSVNKPRFIIMKYKGNHSTARHIALVGKGVTFDSGGTNLKPSDAMDDMRCDMAGAATVFGIVSMIATMELPINVRAYIPLAENIIGGGAIHPGDIVRSYSGKTVEILNTDAEGRLLLADALSLAAETNPEYILDIATLTGACSIALGDFCAGLFSNRRELSRLMLESSQWCGERVWEMPLVEEYLEQIKGKGADLQNMSSIPRKGGAIIAGLFLREFVGSCPWVHLDIAGPGFLGIEHPVLGKNATGFGVRLIYDFIIRTHKRNARLQGGRIYI
ncbi:hypothetical protein RsTz2092_09060 [Deferribacterales bacterium RsTz2092]|nr:hypothetical protein AGMMS49941_06800 [Deferribacterales bacterium]